MNKRASIEKDLRRKRAELSVALRKKARDDQLLKRRALSPESTDEPSLEHDKLPTLEEIIQGLKSNDLATKTLSARAARRMLSREQNPPINRMVSAGCIKPLVEALDRHDCVDLQFEAAWALTNIASGTHEQTMVVVEGGAVPKLVSLLSHGDTVAEQSAWALGNIAGDGPQTRDFVLAAGALPPLMALLNSSNISQLKTAVWTYSNLCRNKNPLVKFDLVSPALPFISELLESTDHDLIFNYSSDACWALSYLTDGPNERSVGDRQPKRLPRLINLLGHTHAAVRTPALRALGNMVTGSDEQTDRCLNADCMPALVALLRCGKAGLVKEAAWAVSNVLAGTEAQIQTAIDAGVLPHLVHVIGNEDPKSQKEAAWAITNLCLGGSGPQLAALLFEGFLEPYCRLLTAPDPKTITVILDGLINLLQAAERFGEVEQLCIKLEEIGALDSIERLQQHENEAVYKKSLFILDKYFAEGEDQCTQPAEANDEYQFGASNQNIASSSWRFCYFLGQCGGPKIILHCEVRPWGIPFSIRVSQAHDLQVVVQGDRCLATSPMERVATVLWPALLAAARAAAVEKTVAVPLSPRLRPLLPWN
ncbi:Importin subunit alpha-1 [Eumeta japonica]|uniref:Importin subunit alpha n=1 Tax=Eumeta variegata TaxID=151549 RepID=A0A4C1Z014_EUMVA|nr:Importin subunit alpha-1 [Eumeta japonica]